MGFFGKYMSTVDIDNNKKTTKDEEREMSEELIGKALEIMKAQLVNGDKNLNIINETPNKKNETKTKKIEQLCKENIWL